MGVGAKRSTDTVYLANMGGVDHYLSYKKVNPMQWMQYAVRSMQWNSGMWWWGHCLWCKKVKPEDAVHRMQWNSGIWWWGHCLWCKNVKPEDAVDTVHSGIVVYGGGDIVFGAKRSNQWMQWTQYMVDNVTTTMYHYSTASTAL